MDGRGLEQSGRIRVRDKDQKGESLLFDGSAWIGIADQYDNMTFPSLANCVARQHTSTVRQHPHDNLTGSRRVQSCRSAVHGYSYVLLSAFVGLF